MFDYWSEFVIEFSRDDVLGIVVSERVFLLGLPYMTMQASPYSGRVSQHGYIRIFGYKAATLKRVEIVECALNLGFEKKLLKSFPKEKNRILADRVLRACYPNFDRPRLVKN